MRQRQSPLAPDMTASKCWHLEDHRASLVGETLSATIDLRRPHDGLNGVRAAGVALSGVSLLGVTVDAGPAIATASPSESYVRGADLVAAYEEDRDRPTRVDVLWRSIEPPRGSGWLAAVDLIVSLRTSQWDAQAPLDVGSRLAAVDVSRMSGGPDADFAPLDLSGSGPIRLRPDAGPGCLLVRMLYEEGLSYAEMVHPADFRLATVLPATHVDGPIGLRYQLFPQALEKGVMLRARVRGLLLPHEHDARRAAEAYAAFAAAEPPLGT